MLTREQIEAIQAESREKGVPIKRLLQEKGVPEHQYFWWKRKYSRESVPEGFLPVSGVMPPAVIAGSAERVPAVAGKWVPPWRAIGYRVRTAC